MAAKKRQITKKTSARNHDDLVTLKKGRFLSLKARGGWEFAERSNASGVVAIVAITTKGRVLFTEQFRPPVAKHVIEFPAGLAGDIPGEEHEDLAVAAERELLEETGYRAEKLQFLYTGTSSAGLTSETLTFFAALGAKKVGPGGGDGNESIVLHEVALSRVPKWLEKQQAAGLLIDAKIYAGLYFAERLTRKS